MKKKVAKQRALVKDKVYPFLVENSKDIEDAKVFISAAGIIMKQQFMNRMTTTTVADLKLQELKSDASTVKRYNDLFDILANESLTDALKVLEGLPQEIDSWIRKENEQRKLSELKADLL